jgi:dTDP-4-amino-4,6-dideoxygalactose transaminase
MSIPFIDLQAQRKALGPLLDEAIQRVLERGDFIQGREVQEFEEALSLFTGAVHSLTCGNGTDALTLVGMAEGLGAGDAVFVPAFTFVATAEAFSVLGATPYLVDVDPITFNLSVESLKQGIAESKLAGLKPKMVVAVDLFGQPADYNSIKDVSEEHGLILVADAAQAFGASLYGKSVGTLADYTTLSFFPAKPLGCYGDGGAILTDMDGKAKLIRSLMQHGKGGEKHDNVNIGLNSRLDTIQAAILLEKLKVFEDELSSRNEIAKRYSKSLEEFAETPSLIEGAISNWAQYTIKLERRDEVHSKLKEVGVPTAVYYPKPLNQQNAYMHYPVVSSGVTVSEKLASKVLSLPMHAYMPEKTQQQIIEHVIDAITQ